MGNSMIGRDILKRKVDQIEGGHRRRWCSEERQRRPAAIPKVDKRAPLNPNRGALTLAISLTALGFLRRSIRVDGFRYVMHTSTTPTTRANNSLFVVGSSVDSSKLITRLNRAPFQPLQ